ncbi:MAG: response regulator [Cypionkella sp.]|uniref:response regulator n=1 Tax=Cypionkella sp. TaxID=2811411 RepID=UPI0026291C89|nr:response regulator [Cypionkella sp.]MDB5658946.1 response regulator [Cypionkella sp.]MDB5665673.1 response regulator [Cypionkella sp.]
MAGRILIVEDEIIVAMDLEATLEDFGFETVGIAADTTSALQLGARNPDVALVDVNLRDGPTGREIGARLARDFGINVVFITANPRMLGDGFPGAVGVLPKPADPHIIRQTVEYILGLKSNQAHMLAPPPALTMFGAVQIHA